MMQAVSESVRVHEGMSDKVTDFSKDTYPMVSDMSVYS